MTNIIMTHYYAVILSMSFKRVVNLLKTIFTRYTMDLIEWYFANL